MSNSENVGPVMPASSAQSAAQKCGSWMDQLIGFIADLIGARTYKAHLLRHMFSDIFKRKHATKVEDCFAVGTASTTPELAQVDTSWPRPWVFFYVLLAGLVVYIGLSSLWAEHTNANLLPGMIFAGSFAVPLSIVVLFMETNTLRNISVSQVIFTFLTGAVISFFIAQFHTHISKGNGRVG